MRWPRRQLPALTWLQVEFDRDLDADQVRNLLLSVVTDASLGRVIFEAVKTERTVIYRIGTTSPHRVSTLLASLLPTVTVQEMQRSVAPSGSAWVVRSNTRRRSLRIDEPEAITQRLLGSLAFQGSIYQLVVGRRLTPRAVPAQLEGLRSESWTGAAFEALAFGSGRIDPEARRALALKQAEAGAEVSMRLLLPEGSARSTSAVSAFRASVRSLQAPGVHLRLSRERWSIAREARAGRQHIALNTSEMSAVTGWPLGELSYPGIDRSGSRVLPAQTSAANERVVGRAVHPATPVDIGLPARDGLRHLWALGPTGVGKSTLLEHLALQDIEDGRGVVVIDPKGDLVDGLLSRASPSGLDRVVVMDPTRTDHVVGFNPLIGTSGVELVADGVLHVLHSLNKDSWGPRTQDVLHASLLTLAESDQPSLVAVPQLLGDSRFRREMTRRTSPVLRSFWSWYEALSDAERASVTAPVLNKIRPFTLRSSLRAMLGQTTPRFDIASVFSEHRVLLVPLRKGQLGAETANLLGSLLLARLWQAAQARSIVAPERRHPVFAYLDEFQDYLRLPTDFADVLAQSRGLGLGLILAHQHLAQLDTDTRAAVSANAQSRVTFRLGTDDAKKLASSSPQLEAVDFTSLRAFSAYADLLNGGQRTGWTSIKTSPPRLARRDHHATAAVLAERFGVSPGTVDESLFGSVRHEPTDEPIGFRTRGES